MSGRGRERERKVLLEGWKSGGAGWIYQWRTAQGREAGGAEPEWERYRRSPQSSNSHGKKKGGGKVDGLSASGYGRYQEQARASAKAKTDGVARKKKRRDRDR